MSSHVNTGEQVQHNIQNAENSEHELEWDDSPEQINLQIDAEQNLENALQPRRLFSDDSDDNYQLQIRRHHFHLQDRGQLGTTKQEWRDS